VTEQELVTCIRACHELLEQKGTSAVYKKTAFEMLFLLELELLAGFRRKVNRDKENNKFSVITLPTPVVEYL